jgi:uncharacterized membrane protein HdeD (DUF308 family)
MVSRSQSVGEKNELWWMGVLGGILTMLFGLAALFWPGMTMVTFVYLFSAYVLVWGAISIVKGFVDMASGMQMWWLTLIFGFLALGVGVYLVRHPLVSFTTLILLTAFTFIIRGVVDIISGFAGDQAGGGRALAFIAGALGVIAGVFLLMQPASAGIAFVWVIGLYALLVGPVLIAVSVNSRNGGDDGKQLA